MDNKNYKLIYELRGYNTGSLANVQAQQRYKADLEADKIHKLYVKALAEALGHENYEISDLACMADGIQNHVYAAPDGSKVEAGRGLRVCVFCGCDDCDIDF